MSNLDPYSVALNKALKELADCDAAADKLECQRARLRQTVAILQSQLGIDVERGSSLTGAILTAVKANPGYSRAVDIAKDLQQLGYNAPYSSVATILARLAKTGQVTHAIGPDRSLGYAWKIDTTRPERNDARKALVEKAKSTTR